MIDGLVSQLGDQVEKLWKRDEGGTGKYPPASIHALLDIYLLDNITETSKHAITIYLLLDIMYSFPNKTDTPIESFPTAFAISWGQVKLVQGFWLLDHNDYENGLDLLFHPVTAKPSSWQHSKIIEAFMSQGEHKQALRYLQTMKPTVSSSSDVILHLTVLLFNNNVLSKIGEVWASHKPRNGSSLYNSPKTEQPSPVVSSFPHPELPEAFVGTPVSKTSERISRLLDLVVHPIPQPSQCLEFIQQSPKRSPLCLLSTSLPSSSQLKRPHQNTSRPSELLLLETPPVVKKAKSLALSATSSGFAEFTPPSILRSGLRTTPLASPSLSPGRSLTPPFRLKETRISFMEEGMSTHWTDKATDDRNAKEFVSTSFHKSGLPAETEWVKNSDKNSYFPLDIPAKGHPKVVTGSLDTHSQSLEKLDVSKEDSIASTRSDQTSLEYHDAPAPEDLEDGIFVSPKSTRASTELTTNLTPQTEKDNDKDSLKSEGAPSAVQKQTGTVEVGVEAFSEFSRLSPVQKVEASLCVSSVCEGTHGVGLILKCAFSFSRKTPTSRSKTLVMDGIVAVESQAFTVRGDHDEPLANVVEDGESSGPITSRCPVTSEHSFDQKLTLNLKEDHDIEADIHVGLPEEKPQVSISPPDTQEIHLIGHEKLEVQNSEEEAKNLSFNELCPSGTLQLQYNFDTIEQQFCDLHDDKESAECDVAEVDGELFVAQSNFTLILEGEEGDIEANDSAAANMPSKSASSATNEKPVSPVEPDNQQHVTDLPSDVTGDQESHKVETLPYVPEPIKVAIAENLLDVIKDTRSKEATSAAVEQVVHEDVALISPKVTHSSKLTKSTLKTVQETSAKTVDTSRDDDMVSTRILTRRQRAQNLNVTSEQHESTAVATPKRKTRKVKELCESSDSTRSDINVASETQPTPQNPLTPGRGKKKRQVSPGTGESPDLKKQEPLEPATEEVQVQFSSVRKGTRRRLTSVENGQSAKTVKDLNISKAASHGTTVRKVRNAHLEDSQNVEYKQEGPSDQQLPLKQRRVRGREVSGSSVIEELTLDSSQLPIQTVSDVAATPRKRGRPRKIVSLEDGGSTAVEEQTSPQKKEVPSVRRSTRNTSVRNVSTLEKSIVVPNEEVAIVMTSNKKSTKKSANKGPKSPLRALSDFEAETTHKETSDREERLLSPAAALTNSSRSTRTRSRKTIVLTDFSEPKAEPLFSPPSAKIPKKAKAEKMEATAQLKELVSDLSSQFVVSPPALRTRRKNVSNTSKLVDELESDPKPLEVMGEQKPKRSRTVKTKASRNTGKESSWSPPPVEIKLISPLASPVDEIKISKPRRTAEVAGKTLQRGKRKLSSFPNIMDDEEVGEMPAPSTDSVRVAVRVRPFSQREKNSGSQCVISMHSQSTTIRDPKNGEHLKTFTFDLAYWSHDGFQKDEDGVLIPANPSSKFAGQIHVFHDIGRGILDSAWRGYNATLLAYGQTGSGKSYSMIGFGTNKGIIPRVCEELFQAIKMQKKNIEPQVMFSMLEIYNEQIRDLLSRTKTPGGLKVREDQHLGFFVEGLKWVPCENYAQIEKLMAQGSKIRMTASTNMNASSSRSHMVITIQFKQVFLDTAITKQSSINMVDLAGSERQKSSGSEGDRLREGSKVNLSLTSLGNVISALADSAMGKKVLHIPYRDSVLTKLLQSALGGNSQTTLIAAISPADICYEETLSTLRYAERAKKVQNRAMINTCTLVRASGAENKQLLGFGGTGAAEHPACLLAEWQLGVRGTWAHLLEQARKEWEEQCAAVSQEQQMMKALPHLLNVNEDPQLTGVLKYFIHGGSCDVGRASSNTIRLQGLGISDKHASFVNLDGKVTVAPHGKCKVVVNGVPVSNRTKLQHLDRIILGSNSAFLYIGFPSERGGEDLSRFDYDFFQLERAAAEGVSVDMLGTVSPGDGQAEPSVLAVFQDYVKLMPLIVEANQMSEELEKGLKMELKVKNLASSDSRGYDLQKEVMVKLPREGQEDVWIWSKAKFINRKFLMEELYQRFLENEDSQVTQEDDPFWDPVEVVHLGSAHIWLQSLAYCMMLEEQVEFLNCDGLEEAVLHIRITPCSPEGWAQDEEDMVTDPLELLGKRIDFQIHIVGCLGVKWLKEDANRGIQLGYKIYDLPNTLYTKPVWKSVNPRIEETVHIVALSASREFLNYLLTNALIVDLWGLQEGCTVLGFSPLDILLPGEGHIMVDTKKLSSVKNVSQITSKQVPEMYQTLLKLGQETELLRDINRALREENVFLKASLEKTGSPQQVQKPHNPERAGMTAQLPVARGAKQMCDHQASCDAQLARALKVFYRGMSMARGQLLRLRQHRPPEDDQMLRPFVHQQSAMLKDLEDLLESSLQKLKNDVAFIVKKKKEYLLHIQQ
ncbi:kinesin KIF28P [Sigmodon hispidus]